MKVAGLFAGIGGVERGFELAGFSSEMLCEVDEAAKMVLASHFPDVALHGDIRTLNALPAVDVIAAGFPCQDLSQAGGTAGIRGKNSGLVSHVFRLLDKATKAKSLKWLVLENAAVRGLRQLERPMRDIAEAMHACLFVHRKSPDANQARQLPGRLAPLQIHLEKAILRVQEAEGPRHVLAGFGGDRRHTERVALDSHRRHQPRDRGRTVDDGKAGAQLGSRVQRAADDQARQDGEQGTA